MRRLRWALCGVLAILVSVILPGATERAAATVPGAEGVIAFASDRDGDFEIYTMSPDGSGGAGADTLWGGAGDDFLFGEAGDDLVFGEISSDGLVGGTGADRLFGGADADELAGGPGTNMLFGGSGSDRCNRGAAGSVSQCESG